MRWNQRYRALMTEHQNVEVNTRSPLTNQSREAESLPREIQFTARLGAPLALGELGWMSTYIVDALMIGRLPHSALSISASSLGNTIFYAIVFCAIRLMTGIDTLVAQSYGGGNHRDCERTLGQSLYFVLLGTPMVMILTLGALHLLPYFGTPPDICIETSHYLHALIWSTAPLLTYMALRFYLQGTDRVVLVMVSLVTSAVVNWAGDWALLYGHLGKPMGIAGSGWATCIVRLYMMALLILGISQTRRNNPAPFNREILVPNVERLRILVRIGWPAALNSLTDLGVSTYLSILCARLGARLLAAHQVVLDLDAVVYMVPMGISWAALVRVGQAAGRNNISQVLRSARASIILALGYIVVASCLFAGFPHTWAGLYTNDPSVVAAAAPIFLICGILQIGDAADVIYASALTGLGDTRSPFIINGLWYWALGMPLSYWLTFHNGMEVEGLWLGRAIAAIGSGANLALLWHARMRTASTSHKRTRLTLLTSLHAREIHS
jgi:MATE family multidrug resistance protein